MADSPTLSATDHAEILQTLTRLAHAFDNNLVDSLGLIFTADVQVELGQVDGGESQGLDAIRELLTARPDVAPDHQTVGTVLLVGPDGTVRARSRYVATHPDGSTTSGDYLDVLIRTADGWRISFFRSVLRYPADPAGVPRPTGITDEWIPSFDRLPRIVG